MKEFERDERRREFSEERGYRSNDMKGHACLIETRLIASKRSVIRSHIRKSSFIPLFRIRHMDTCVHKLFICFEYLIK